MTTTSDPQPILPILEAGGLSDAGHGVRRQLDAGFRAQLMNYFYRRVGDRVEAEDLTQEVCLRLVKQVENVSLTSATAYAFTVAANLLRDRARRAITHRVNAHRSIDEAPDGFGADANFVEEISPERVLLGRERLQAVVDALEELDERTRAVFLLCRLERMPQREVADLYGMTTGAVEKRILKATLHLIACLRG